jgi:WD40 repeat protein/serine/threonine protein kinase
MTRRDDETLTHHGSAAAETMTHHGSASTPAETLTHGARETLTHGGPPARVEPISAEPGWSPGSVVDDRWEVFGAARGGMGQVYFVRDRAWGNTTLAVKSLLGHSDRLATSRKLFRRETQVWMDLGAHQNIVSGFYTLEIRGALRFFMEYVAGESLAEVVARGLELPRALDLAIQLCAGMQYVHVRDVVHRDLKPANCLVMEDDTLRVTDFGLGKAVADPDAVAIVGEPPTAADPSLSLHGAGTPYYMAPEQWSSLAEAHKPADVYAFGVILYELLGGGRPFTSDPAVLRRYSGQVPPLLQQLIDGGAPMEQLVLRMFHQHATPFSLSTVRSDVPAGLDSIAQTCLAKQPVARPVFGALRDELIRHYTNITGHPYRRQLPDALAPSEAGENNRAVSYYTMGDRTKATAILDAWLANDPKALYPWINRHTIGLREAQAEPAEVADRFARELVRSHPGAFDGRDSVAGFARTLARFRFEHPAKVLSVAISADGTQIATGCEDRTVRVFETASGAVIARHDNLADLVLAVVFCADGSLAAANGTTIAVWDRAGSSRTLVGHGELVTSLAVAADGTLWSASNDRTARAWEVATGRETLRLKKHDEIVRGIATSPDGSRIVTCSFDRQVRVWSAAGELLRTFEDGVVQTIARFAPDGRTLWTGGSDGALRRWDADTGTLVASYREHAGGLAALAVRGDRVVTGGADQTVRLWDATSGEVIRRLSGHRAPVRGIQFLDAARLVTASDDHTVRVWPLDAIAEWPLHIRRDVAVGRRRELDRQKRALIDRATTSAAELAELRAFRDAHEGYRRDDELLAAEHALGKQHGAPVGCREAFVAWTEATPAPAASVSFSAQGDAVFVATEAELWRYAVDRRTAPRRIANLVQPVACEVTRDGTHVLSAGPSGIAVWAADGTDTRTLEGAWSGRGTLHGAAIAGDGSIVVAGGWSRGVLRASWQAQGTLRAWRLRDREELKFKQKGHAVLAVAVSHDGALIAAGMDDGEVALWDGRSRERQTTLAHPGKPQITAVALSDRLIASGGSDGTACLWRADTRTLIGTAAQHVGRVTSLSISDDQSLLASAGVDGNVSLYLGRSLLHLRTLEGHAESAVAAFGPGARQLVSAGRDRLLRLWTLDLEWR